MISIGSKKELAKLKVLLVTHHRLDVIISLMDLSHKHNSNISSTLLSGQVTMDVTAEVTRSATLELLDPLRRLKLDTQAPTDGSLFMTQMIRVTYVISTPDRGEQYFIPIFTGPLTKVTRTGPVLNVEAQGKEIISFSSMWKGKTFKKNLKKVDVIQRVMKLSGEALRHMDLRDPRPHARLPENLSTNRAAIFWKIARKLAVGMNMQLFYDGRGVLRLRKTPGKVAYVFRQSNSAGRGALMTEPQITYDSKDMYNAVEIRGGKGKGKKKKLNYRLVANRKHPLSPWNLGRNGEPRYLPLVIEDDSIKTKKKAKQVAKKQLKNALDQAVEVTFDALPIPMIEESDLCGWASSDSSGRFRMKQMTIPLTANGVSSIGYLRQVVPRKVKVRKTKKRRAA
jgi:hypothetical protein